MRIACRGRRAPGLCSSFHLSFEALESRDIPSGPGDDLLIVNPTPPQIVNFSAACIQAGGWEFSGDVVDQAPGGLTVTLGGEPASLQGVTTTTDSNGHFDIVVLLHTDGTDNGFASAQTTDGQNLPSNVATYYVLAG